MTGSGGIVSSVAISSGAYGSCGAAAASATGACRKGEESIFEEGPGVALLRSSPATAEKSHMRFIYSPRGHAPKHGSLKQGKQPINQVAPHPTRERLTAGGRSG
jgi:hypothetical protein